MLYVKSVVSIDEFIKKSRFIGTLIPCQNEKEIIIALKALEAEHPTASHIAFAYRIKTENGLLCRFHDAGEPGGTAGKPILQHLEGKNLINILLAVTRYFGGVKLGAGGLTRAYGNSAKQVIEKAEIFPYVEFVNTTLQLAYKQLQPFEYRLKKLDGEIISQEFAESVNLIVKLPKQNLQTLLENILIF